jgi:hypothetical protein
LFSFCLQLSLSCLSLPGLRLLPLFLGSKGSVFFLFFFQSSLLSLSLLINKHLLMSLLFKLSQLFLFQELFSGFGSFFFCLSALGEFLGF